jgi:branched-subunit amino acid ABC-type transport system permease component
MLQIIADGLIIGSVVSLGAIGLSLTFSILRFSNFGHGELLAWGDGVPAPFAQLQQRLGRKRLPAALLARVPVTFVAKRDCSGGRLVVKRSAWGPGRATTAPITVYDQPLALAPASSSTVST